MSRNLPALLEYKTEAEYKAYYKTNLMKQAVFTFDGIRVYFTEQRFWHACEERDETGKKSIFSFHRASYLSWIKYTLESPDTRIYKGTHERKTEADRRVSLLCEKFVVVLQMGLNSKGELKANFITSFPLDGGAMGIKKSQLWNKEDCLNCLNLKKKKG